MLATAMLAGAGVAAASLIDPASTAVPRNAQYDVLGYGAKGDGRTDDTSAITSAINAANTNPAGSGGIVFFPPGTYKTGPLPLYSNIVYLGAGINATTIKLGGGSGDLFSGGAPGAEVNSFSFQQLTLDGDKAGGDGIHVHGFGFTTFNLVVRRFAGRGIASAHDLSADGLVDSMEAMLVTTKVHDCDAGGIYWDGPHDSMFTDLVVYQNGPFSGSKTAGIETTSRGAGLVAVGCHVWGNNHLYGWRLGADALLSGCQGEGAIDTQVVILANDTEIIGGKYYAAGNNTKPKGIQIGATGNDVAGTMIRTQISGCLGGAINLQGDGGSSILAPLVYQTSGSAFVGHSPSSSSLIALSLNGGALNGLTGTHDSYSRSPGIQVALGGIGLGNYVQASGSPGALVRKFPVYDSRGNPVGYVPVYR